ncbi:S8 family serine peptidase [Lysobacter sp. K5869]|uniref:S8 family serine peptidase n=1 Tax=Lysobacter sp. K5869 TaxID=2820808 RepID=UPI001C062907|nr:S8 family serine peptidase [Lysobacter sp. K5869]QWP75774.1 S8 family serine peptidase [Lysobacter sp. K5869]
MPLSDRPRSHPLLRFLAPCLALAVLPAAVALAAPPRQTLPKPIKTQLGRYDSREFIEVKFAPDAQVRLQSGRLSSAKYGRLDAIDALTGAAGPVASLQALFPDAAVLSSLAKSAQAEAPNPHPELGQWFRLRVKPGQDIARVIDQLNALPAVETAYPAPLPAPPPATPDFQNQQYYKNSAYDYGIDIEYARGFPGGDGAGIRVLDLEYSWNTNHEDVSKLRLPGARIGNGTPVDPYNDLQHGTAVMAMLVGDANGIGVSGLVRGASAHITNVMNTERGYEVANAILVAANGLRAGDVMLIEQQAVGPANCNGFVPVEWIPSVYDAIVVATNKGIHVVEAGGNGAMNLDNAACFGSPFPAGRPDSGAIIVGAGGPLSNGWCSDSVAPLDRQPFSTYGARFNLQGWGRCVTTAGYGDLHNAGANANYTRGFAGTSSASPMVAAAVVSLSGIAKRRGQTLTPAQMRDLLWLTGLRNPSAMIGALPNLRKVIDLYFR